jgi:6-phosphogluconate dehydrogenase
MYFGMQTNQIGIIGLGTMGSALAQNFANHNIKTAVYNRSFNRTKELIEKNLANISGYGNLEEFVFSLEMPRKIILMVPAGAPVDEQIENLEPLLGVEDMVVDMGNSYYKDTIIRENKTAGKFIFLGCGISGGEEGALQGASIMLGGDSQACAQILPFLEKVAAKSFDKNPTAFYAGASGAGHFVKMVHNGIEYGIMQGIAETYQILKYSGKSNLEIADILTKLNTGNLESYLLEITIKILRTEDEFSTGSLLDKILPIASSKGTGNWTAQTGLEFGVPIPSLCSAVFARILSNPEFSFINNGEIEKTIMERGLIFEITLENIKNILESVFLTSYIQGLDLIYKVDLALGMGVNMSELLKAWQGGCIIRSKMLVELVSFPEISNLLYETKKFLQIYSHIRENIQLSLPVMDATMNYFYSIYFQSETARMIQAQRDYFGAHTYRRIDREGDFSGGW